MPNQGTRGRDPHPHRRVQIYGGSGTRPLKGNYFHDNGNDSAGGLSSYGNHDLIDGQRLGLHLPLPVVDPGKVIAAYDFSHNTFAGGGGLHFYISRAGDGARQRTSRQRLHRRQRRHRDSQARWGTEDHNLNSGLSGPGRHHRHTRSGLAGRARPATAAITSPPLRPGRAQPPTAPTWA